MNTYLNDIQKDVMSTNQFLLLIKFGKETRD